MARVRKLFVVLRSKFFVVALFCYEGLYIKMHSLWFQTVLSFKGNEG